MISAHNIGSASDALSYFSKDNYYTEREGLEESEWFGKGAAALGLKGTIDKKDFLEMLNGHVNGQQLGKLVKNENGDQERDHRPGIDLTFSAPKSVSIMTEIHGASGFREAHEGALKTALGYVERQLAYTRQMRNGELESVKTGNLVVGMIRHNTSRDLDPQTHTHSVVMNATKRDDGRWRSLTNDELYKAQRLVGAIYTSELADRIQALGYEIRRTDDRGNFEIAGINREQIEHFSQRRASMEAAMKERGLNIDTATPGQKEVAALATRERKTEVDHADLLAEWKERAQAIGIDFGAIDRQAHDKLAAGRATIELGGDQLKEVQAALLGAKDTLVEWAALYQEHESRITWMEPQRHYDAIGDLLETMLRVKGEQITLGADEVKDLQRALIGVRDVLIEWQVSHNEEVSCSAWVDEMGEDILKKSGWCWDEPQQTYMATANVLGALDLVQGLQHGLEEKEASALRHDRLTGRAAIEFATAHLIEREAVVSKNEILQVAIEHGAGRVSALAVERAFVKLEKDGHLVHLPDGNYTTAKMLGSEQWALDQVRDTRGTAGRIMDAAAVQGRLLALEKRQRFAYTEGQKEAIAKVLTSDDRFVGVQGLAGTGKTTMLRGLREIAQEHGYTVRGMAATGQASKVLGLETGIPTTTVAMFQIQERQLEKDIKLAQQYAPDWKRQKELWIVDESSFLSQRQKAQLDHMAGRAEAKVVYLGDTLQLQGVEAGKPFEMAQSHGLDTAKMTEIQRQNTSELKAAVAIVTGQDRPGAMPLRQNARAFDYMDKTGMVKEIKNDSIGALVGDIVKMDKAERDRTIVITAYNKDRHAINDGVRYGLQQRGELSRNEQTREVLNSKGWTRAVIKEAQYYKPGDVVRFGRDYQVIDASKGEYMRVAAVDAQRGLVTLEKENGMRIDWHPRKNNTVEVYDADRRSIAAGDLIRSTRSDEIFKNGEVARVESLTGNVAMLQLGAGSWSIDLDTNKHWDHAYASTVHAAQGSTQHRVLFHIRVPETDSERAQAGELQRMVKVFGDRSFYVGTTRASDDLAIYTNDKALAARAVAGHQDKRSAVATLEKSRQPEMIR